MYAEYGERPVGLAVRVVPKPAGTPGVSPALLPGLPMPGGDGVGGKENRGDTVA